MDKFTSPLTYIVDYYDSLINQIDLYTERLLSKTSPTTILDDLPSEESFVQAMKPSNSNNNNNNNNKEDYDVDDDRNDFGVKAYKDPYSSKYKHDETLPTDYYASVVPASRTLHDYANLSRKRMIVELRRLQDETIEYYKSEKNEIDAKWALVPGDSHLLDREMSIRQILFAKKYTFLLKNHSKRRDLKPNKLAFNLILVVLDFFIDDEEGTDILKHYLSNYSWRWGERFMNYLTIRIEVYMFDQADLLIYAIVQYINEKLSRSKYGNELIHINSSTLETIEKFCLNGNLEDDILKSIRIHETNAWDWSRVKSLHGWYFRRARDRVTLNQLCAFPNLEYLNLQNFDVNVEIFDSFPKLKNLSLNNCNLFDQNSEDLFDPENGRYMFDPSSQVCNLNHLEVLICIYTNCETGFIFNLAGFPSLVWLSLTNVYLTHSHLESIKSLAHQLVVLEFKCVKPSENYFNVSECEKKKICEGSQAESDAKSSQTEAPNLEDEFASLFTTGTFWKLKKLVIKDQYFTSFKPDWFLKMPLLEVLVLSGNKYKRLEDQSFACLRNLKILKLNNLVNYGIDIEANAFDGLPNLKKLIFSVKLYLTGAKLSAFLQMVKLRIVKNSNVQNFKELCDGLDKLDLIN